MKDVLALMFDLFTTLSKGALDVLTHEIHIPIISWLYKKISSDPMTVLDVLCLIAAIPITLISKIVSEIKLGKGITPFSKDDPNTTKLSKGSFADIQSILNPSNVGSLNLSSQALKSGVFDTVIKKVNFSFGIIAFNVGGMMEIVVLNDEEILSKTGLGIIQGFCMAICGISMVTAGRIQAFEPNQDPPY